MRTETRKKILVVCPYPVGVAAGQRLKYEQYLNNWRDQEYDVTVSPFMNMAMWRIVHGEGRVLTKAVWTLIGLARRIWDFFRLDRFDIVYIFMYVNPIGGTGFERAFRKRAKKLIFDLEDNRFLQDETAASNTTGLRSVEKTRYLVETADHVITSSPALNDYCLTINKLGNCTYISSSIDTERFVPNNRYSNEHKIVIGWTGTFSTRPYLDLLRPVFIELRKLRDFRLVVIGNFSYDFPEMDMDVIQWSAETEVVDLQKIDIGVYPLPMNEWVMGKSGLKAIQYMSFGLPCVASNISTVQQFIVDHENGLLVENDIQWVEALTELIDSPALRKRVGENARRTVMTRFSKHVVREHYLNVLGAVLAERH